MKNKTGMREMSEEAANAYYEAYTKRESKRLQEIEALQNSLYSCYPLRKFPKPFYIHRLLNLRNPHVQMVFINLFH